MMRNPDAHDQGLVSLVGSTDRVRHCPRCEVETLDGSLCASCREETSHGLCAVGAPSCGRAMANQSLYVAFPICARCSGQLVNTVRVGGYDVCKLGDLTYAVISAISRGAGARWWLVKHGQCSCPQYRASRPCIHARAVYRLFGDQLATSQEDQPMPKAGA